jgi:uncharacterized protein
MQHALRLLLKTTFKGAIRSFVRPTTAIYVAALALTIPCTQAQESGKETTDHIALILPLKSDTLGRQADAVRQGALQAVNVNKGALRVVVHATSDDPKEIQATYDRATSEGARAVIGPLSRSAVTSLARTGKVSVPTLALNAPEGDVVMPRNLFIFGLQVDPESRQLARMANKKGFKRAFIVSVDTPVSSRIVQAFKEEWLDKGGIVTEEFSFNADSAILSKLKDRPQATQADFVLLALDSARAKAARPYINGSLTVLATSLAHGSNDALENFELDGVVFLDMPWLLLPDHPAVMSHGPSTPSPSLEFQRFYALGIDAYRLALEMLGPTMKIDDEPLDGVTGLVTRGENQRFIRELIPAEFRNGIARSLADTTFR